MTDAIDKTKPPPGWRDCSGEQTLCYRTTCYSTFEQAWEMAEQDAEPFIAPLLARIAELSARVRELEDEVKIAWEDDDEVAQLRDENSRLKASIAELEAALKVEHDRHWKCRHSFAKRIIEFDEKFRKENSRLKARIGELEAK